MEAQHLQRLGAATLLVVLLVPFGLFLLNLNWHPELDGEEIHWLARSQGPADDGLTLMWLGAAGVYISDGETHLLIDGFFSRPSRARMLLGKLAPEPERIRTALDRADVRDLDAVAVTHAHHDHVLDAPWLAEHFDALLLGSSSAANVARGQGLAEALIREVDDNQVLRVGEFRLRFPPSDHRPLPPMMARLLGTNEAIERPLTVPARLNAWREGQTRAVHISHPRGKVLIQPSAGFHAHALRRLEADVALVSIQGLGKQSASYQADYVRHAVEAARPDWVVPIHWDDFSRPLTDSTPALPLLFENVAVSLQALNNELHNPENRVRLVRPLWRLQLVYSDDGVELIHEPSF